MPRPHLKLLTYNIHKGFNITNRKFVLHQIRETLQETNVDMAFLQEIHGEHTGHQLTTKNWPEVSQHEFLADQIWPLFPVVVSENQPVILGRRIVRLSDIVCLRPRSSHS